MANSYFDIRRENKLIAAGTHFWCEGHLSATPVDDMSQDSRCCLDCYAVLKAETEMLPIRRESLMPGVVEKTTKVNISRETAPAATQTTPARQEVVAKIKQHGNPPITEKQVVLQHPGGRPRKQGEVHRATKWRRQKEAVQGVLV